MMISKLISEETNVHPFRRWMRHMAVVPKGFLRFYVLRLLDEKTMSGSEIMNEIEKQTNGQWKPSPGSIYPLLSWLQDKGYVRELSEQEVGTKRYTLTEEGKAFLGEHIRTREELHKRFRHFGFGLGPMWFELYPEKAKQLQRATRDLAIAVWNLRDRLRREYSEEAAEEAKNVLEEAARKIEAITKRLEG